MASTLHYLVFMGKPSPENLDSIKIFSNSIEINSTERLSKVTAKITEHPELRDAYVTFFKPQFKTVLSATIARRVLEGKENLEEYADELVEIDTMQEIFGVAANEMVPQWTLIACVEHPSMPTRVPAAPTQDDDEATGIVGKMKRDFKKYTTAVASGKTPSAAAKSTNYSDNQNTETAPLDGRVKESGKTTNALPIELYYPAFMVMEV